MSTENSKIIAARVRGKLMVYDGDKSVNLLINNPNSPSYIPQPRFDHCSSLIGDKLYIHGGECCSLNAPIVEEYDPQSEQWHRQSTAGDIPEAKSGMASAHCGNKFYAFGGEIKTKVYSNVLSELDTTTMIWRTLNPLDLQGAPCPKRDAAMISYKNYMIIFGGFGVSASKNKLFQFVKGSSIEGVWTNEVTLFDIKRSRWIGKNISGVPPEPCSECTLTYIGQDKALLLGGIGKHGKVGIGTIDSVKILDLLNWVWIPFPCQPLINSYLPEYCYGHCTVSLHEIQDSSSYPSVLLLWGRTDHTKYQEDMWQLTLRARGGVWRKVQFLKGHDGECPPAYKFTTNVLPTKSGMQLVRFGGMVMDKKSPLGNTWILDLQEFGSGGINEIHVVNCRVPKSDYILGTETSIDTKNSETEDGYQSKTETSNSIGDSSMAIDAASTVDGKNVTDNCSSKLHSDSNNGCSLPYNKTLNLKRKSDNDPLNGDSSSALSRSNEYLGLNVFDQKEDNNIKHSNKEQDISMKSIGLSVTIPPDAVPPEQNVIKLTVAPAVSGNIAAPPDCRPHSPLYMMPPCNLAKEVTVRVNHTCCIENEEDCANMVVLVPVDLTTSKKTGKYTLKEADVEKVFKVGSQTGEIKMKTLQPFRVAKKVSLSQQGKTLSSKKLYTLRVYKNSCRPCTPGECIVFGISQLHPSYLKCLQDQIMRQNPKLVLVEKFDTLQFADNSDKIELSIPNSKEINGWTIDAMKKEITRDEVDLPDQMNIAGVDYPPTMTLFIKNGRSQPSQNGTKCCLKASGFNKEIEVTISLELLKRPKVQSMPRCNGIFLSSPKLYSDKTILEPEDLKVVYNALKEVSPLWRSFGLQLNLRNYVLENILSKPVLQGNDGYFTEMLNIWLQKAKGEAKSVKKLKEALCLTSCQHAASELLVRLNDDYRNKYQSDIKEVLSSFRKFLDSWQENKVVNVLKESADHLDNQHRLLCASPDVSHVAEEIHRVCLDIISNPAVEKIIAISRDENESVKYSLVDASTKLNRSLKSQTGTTLEILPRILMEIQSLKDFIEELFTKAEKTTSLCVHHDLLEWEKTMPGHYSMSV